MKYIALLILISCTYNCNLAVAEDYKLSISLNSSYVANSTQYKPAAHIDNIEQSVIIRISQILENGIVLSLSTNRLFNNTKVTAVKHKQTGQHFILKTKITADTVSIGRKLNNKFSKFLPSFFVSSVRVDNSLYDSYYLVNEVKRGYVFGVNVDYYLTPITSTSLFFAFPSDKVDLKFAAGMGFNYYF